jgi:hypothetical protein
LSGIAKLWRSTAFRLLLAYLFIFIVFAFFTLGYVAWNARRVLDDQIVSTVEAEITGLSEQYRLGGIRRLVNIVERRARQPGASLYLLATPAAMSTRSRRGSPRSRAGSTPSPASGAVQTASIARAHTAARAIPTRSRIRRSCGSSPYRAAFACLSGGMSRSGRGCAR